MFTFVFCITSVNRSSLVESKYTDILQNNKHILSKLEAFASKVVKMFKVIEIVIFIAIYV